jgi:hypothetical protein
MNADLHVPDVKPRSPLAATLAGSAFQESWNKGSAKYAVRTALAEAGPLQVGSLGG